MFIIDISKTKFLLNAYLLTPARQCGLVLEGRAAHLSKVLNSVPSFCLSESNQCRASTMLSLKRCKNGTQGQCAYWTITLHLCILQVSQGCIWIQSKCCKLHAPLGDGEQQSGPPHLLQSTRSCKATKLLADFLIYLYASPWIGKGKGKVLIYEFCFQKISPLWLAEKHVVGMVSLPMDTVFTSTREATQHAAE